MKSILIVFLLVSAPWAAAITVPATAFPDDGSTATFTTADSKLTFTTTNFFSVQGDFVGDGGPGSTANLVNAWNGSEQLHVALSSGIGLTGFRLRWTNSTLVITGFDSDPGAVVTLSNGSNGTVNWNAGTKVLSLICPWDAGQGRVVTFTNPVAGIGHTLNFAFSGVQAAFTEFSYGVVNATPLSGIVSFKASPQNRVPSGSAVTLSWNVSNATVLTLDPGGIDVTGTTSRVVNPTARTTYTLSASDGVNPNVQKSVTLSVGATPFPNIIVFFLDDFGWADWQQNGAATGSTFYETPNMNRLAAEGKFFSNGYAACPVCSPTRGALLSGQAPALNKLTDWISGRGDSGQPVREAAWTKKLASDAPNFARILADGGYRAIHVGKWHLGAGTSPEAEPLNFGFDVNIGGNQYGTPPAPERYFASASGFSNLPNLGPSVAPAGSYLTDVLTEQAKLQIKSAVADDAAFVMYLSHYAVHTPLQAPAATVQKYQAKLATQPTAYWQGQTNPTYAAMIEHVDRSLGVILDTLEDPDGNPATNDSIAGNTLVILTADNGGLLSSTSNRPLRDGKGGNYDGGVREPWIFWQPGTIAPGIVSEPVITHDLFPTLLSRAGLTAPAGYEVSGQDLSPLIDGGEFHRRHPLVFHYPHWSPADQIGSPFSAIRKGDWKLVYNYVSGSWELYNLATNPGETNNLIASQPEREAVMSWLLSEELERLDANYPRDVTTSAELPPVPLVRPDQDSDNDGRSDLDESIEGTDKLDSQSFFAPQPLLGPSSFSLPFVGKAGRFYQLQASADLLPGSWQAIASSGPLASSGPVNLEDNSAPTGFLRRFYRIATDLP